ncbi:MAG TPA: hypothetical protein VHI98_06240 [Vicinamibacterales bacterium]|nr:hypothetical protein [Vicinamibacterales bacterium]
MAASALFYVGAVTMVAGLVSLIWPVRLVGIRTRRRAVLIAAAGLGIVLVAAALPHPTHTATARDTLLDQWLPEWQFGEYHERRVQATPQQVAAAIRRVTASDIFLFRTLTFIRNPRRQSQSEHILNPPDERPIIDVALAGGFVLLGEEVDRELLLGTVVIAPPDVRRAATRGDVPALDPGIFRTLDRPGFARAAMNFRIVGEGNGWTKVTTETRVHAVDPETQRRFARYWCVIYPGSWIIRWNWLKAVEARLAP